MLPLNKGKGGGLIRGGGLFARTHGGFFEGAYTEERENSKIYGNSIPCLLFSSIFRNCNRSTGTTPVNKSIKKTFILKES